MLCGHEGSVWTCYHWEKQHAAIFVRFAYFFVLCFVSIVVSMHRYDDVSARLFRSGDNTVLVRYSGKDTQGGSALANRQDRKSVV